MKKLFLAVSIFAAFLASSPIWAAESVKKDADVERAQRKIAQAALTSWAKDVARDMQLSADPLARAMGDVSLQLWAAQDDVKISTSRLTAEQKQALYSAQTPLPIRILYLQAACFGYSRDPLCRDAKLADAMIAADSKNAFTILLGESMRTKTQLQEAMTEQGASSESIDIDELQELQAAKDAARVLIALQASNVFNDYAHALKAPVLIAVKRRPPPLEVFAGLPIEVATLTAAFAPEEIAAETVANAFIALAATSYQMTNACTTAQSNELKAQCERVRNLILANPKNSALSAAYALSQSENHPYSKRISAFDKGAQEKVLEPSTFLTLDWLALRSVLNKAATQGDVAAIPAALSWAEMAYAKIPNKSPEAIAAEAKARAEREAKWAAESNLDAADAAAADATAAAVAAAKAATSTAEEELKRQTAKPSGSDADNGLKANNGLKVNPVATDFKSDGL